ncbi:galactosyltransferase-related protein [Streptomyces griseoviridis]|uniref:Glycosyltransferase n=1 Tax=Streptomyces griseoviridis TaxID=45398 RepID=A0ABT9LNZ3_STRGD|nr:galactosyltransferase-related protein [Streptomyces griseoviridis]MDP9685248.1 hypothetical protein [Streptomyces griseoviridis]GGS95845.1 hypothetical protein GCM10010240_31490 [Streptomyces griseoviridis]
MTALMSTDPRVLAQAVADSIVVANDPEARRACLLYWQYARPRLEHVLDAATGHADPGIAASAGALAAHPQDPARHRALTAALAARGADDPYSVPVFTAAWEAESVNRLGHHLGARYRTGADPVDVQELLAVPPAPGRADEDAELVVVIPFRDRDTGGARLRNLLACLAALADQSYDRGRYRVTVVEADDRPRWRQAVEARTDRYVFAPKPGLFNKSWAVNVGVVETAGAAEAICVLDADVLVDREFVARNAARFRRPGTSGHLTYRNMLNLGERASDAAVRTRVLAGAAEADTADLRGFVLRRPPGCCLWVRTEAFHRIGGMDERYEGWGGEDNDFAYRMDFHTAFDSYDDVLLHLAHPPAPATKENGELFNAHIPMLSWRPGTPIGRVDRFATEE